MKEFRIGTRLIGPNMPPFVIAEAGINHDGDFDKAIQLVDAARECGADCIKFQDSFRWPFRFGCRTNALWLCVIPE